MTSSGPDDFSQFDDPAFLAERARVRAELERQGDPVNRADLERLYEAMNREFDRRARIAWTTAN